MEKPSVPQTPIKLDKDAEYFWDFVLFSCEGCVFRVPKYRFISDSEIFATEIGLNVDNKSDSSDIDEALSTLSAIELDVSAEDFRHFLKALHPRYPEQSLELSKREWLSVLRLSTKWFFNDFRKRAIDNLTALDLNPVEKVHLGTRFNVSSWLKTGFRELVTRTEIITVEDARQIELETAIKVYGIRDGWNKLEIPRDEAKLDTKIEAAFASELGVVHDVERRHLPAQERKREEEAATAKELEKQEETKHQEDLERLQKAVEDVGRLLEEHNAALDDFKKAQRALTNAVASPNPTAEKATTPLATSATAAAVASPAPSVLSSPSQTAVSTDFSSSTPVSAPTLAASTKPSTEAAARPATTTGAFGSPPPPGSAFSFGSAFGAPSKASGSLFGTKPTSGSSAWGAFGK